LVGPINGKIVLKRQTVHAECRRCVRSPTVWFTQNGWASAVDSTAEFLNSVQLPSFSG